MKKIFYTYQSFTNLIRHLETTDICTNGDRKNCAKDDGRADVCKNCRKITVTIEENK